MTSGSSTLQSSLRSELEEESQRPLLDDDVTELGVGIIAIPWSNIARLFGLATNGGDGDSPTAPANALAGEALPSPSRFPDLGRR